MKRLYLRIYFAVLASLVAFAVLAGFAWHLWSESHERPQVPTLLAQTATELLPAEAGQSEIVEALQRWRTRTGADLALHAADGAPIASVGAALPAPRASDFEADERGAWLRRGRGPAAYAMRLDDGRMLVARRAHRGGWFSRAPLPGFLSTIVLIALAIGVGAYPVVRRITRRLEGLQRGVEQLGAGDLGARVAESGRDEIASLAKSFNRAAARIETLVDSHKSLLANASHELRSPLARIRMAVGLIGDAAPPSTRAELERSVAELDQLVDEILLASRLDAGAGPQASDSRAFHDQDAVEVDLTALVAEECARTGAQLDAQPAIVHGDARLLRRLVRNLLENAVRYGAGEQADVRVWVEAVAPANAGSGRRARGTTSSDARETSGAPSIAIVEVCDRGPGVAEDERERIFEAFYRARGASERSGGVGLGLSLVRQIARLHRGEVSCAPRSGGGSCFRVELPAGALTPSGRR